MAISFWCQVGAFGTLVLLFLTNIAIGSRTVEPIRFLSTLVGAANWLLALAALGFLLSGPRRGRLFGLAAGALAAGVLHLACTAYIVIDPSSLAGSSSNRGLVVVGRAWEAGVTTFFHFQASLLLGALQCLVDPGRPCWNLRTMC